MDGGTWDMMTGLVNLPEMVSFSQLSANIFVVWTLLLRTTTTKTNLEHFLCKGHTQRLTRLSVSVLRAGVSADLLSLVWIVSCA